MRRAENWVGLFVVHRSPTSPLSQYSQRSKRCFQTGQMRFHVPNTEVNNPGYQLRREYSPSRSNDHEKLDYWGATRKTPYRQRSRLPGKRRGGAGIASNGSAEAGLFQYSKPTEGIICRITKLKIKNVTLVRRNRVVSGRNNVTNGCRNSVPRDTMASRIGSSSKYLKARNGVYDASFRVFKF